MRVLVLGGSGMLGSDFVAELQRRGHEAVAPAAEELDLGDPISIAQVAAKAFGEFKWCVNCAAYTEVDKAESEQGEAYGLNALGPGYLAQSCSMAMLPLMHVSTDFVFDGQASEPYAEDAKLRPIGFYGKSKADGEEAVQSNNGNSVILRTSWLFGPNGKSFPKTMINAWLAGKTLRVVSDQVGCPTYTVHLAAVMVTMLEKNVFPGIYHAVGSESMSWRDLAELTLNEYKSAHQTQAAIEVHPIKTEDWPTPAKRPSYSVLSTSKLDELGITPMPPLKEALREFVSRLGA